MAARRFTYVGGGSKKFWEIWEPTQVDDSKWIVTVKFGRIGQWGQERVHVEQGKWSANQYYFDKVHEKERKGYKEAGGVEIKKNVVTYQPTYVPAPAPPVCKHDNLSRAGSKWKCSACKKEVDFGKDAAPVSVVEFEVVTKVRRFFNLSARESE